MDPIVSLQLHPLVLLSVADHFNRSGKNTKKRVVGTLLGSIDFDGNVEITNSFGVPFEEGKDKGVWFLDHKYHERMHKMFLKVNAKEKVVGWYSTGPNIKPIDNEITKIYHRYCENPILLVADPNSEENELYKTYLTDQINGDMTNIQVTLKATDPEEIGIDQLLRDLPLNDSTKKDENQLINSLQSNLNSVSSFLRQKGDGQLLNERIVSSVQNIMNDALISSKDEKLSKALVKNEMESQIVMFVCCLTRCVLTLSDLIQCKKDGIDLKNKEMRTDAEESGSENEIEVFTDQIMGDNSEF